MTNNFLVAIVYTLLIVLRSLYLLYKKESPSSLFFQSGLFCILVGVIFSIWSFQDLRSVSSIKPYNSEQVGQMVITGTASAMDARQSEVAPVSETPCISYELLVREHRKGGGRHAGYYYPVLREQQGLDNLGIQTPTGIVQIKPESFEFTHSYLEDKQDLTKDFEDPHTLPALKARHVNTGFLSVNLIGLRVRESLIQAGDKLTVIGDHIATDKNPPVLEAAIIRDQPIEQIVKDARIEFAQCFSIVAFGCAFWVVSKFLDYS